MTKYHESKIQIILTEKRLNSRKKKIFDRSCRTMYWNRNVKSENFFSFFI